MKKISQNKPFVFGAVICAGLMVIFGIVSIGSSLLFPEINPITSLAITASTQLILSIIVILASRYLSIIKGWFQAKGTGKGLLLGWICIVYAAALLLINVLNIPAEDFSAPKLWPLFISIAVALTTGIFEEVLVRGFLLNLILNKNGTTRKGIINACWISSISFGVLHLFNIFIGAGIIETIAQVIYATFLGMLFAAIFIRTKSLWAPIILHALIDIHLFIPYVLLSDEALANMLQQTPSETTSGVIISSVVIVALVLPALIVALVLLRKKRVGGE